MSKYPVCPIAELCSAIYTSGKPNLEWVVRWSRGGRDPVQAAWENALSGSEMAKLLYLADETYLHLRLRHMLYSQEKASVAEALQLVPAECVPTLDKLLNAEMAKRIRAACAGV